jgi:outer membrane protein assembly factor BamB
VVVDGTLVQGDCEGALHGYDLSDPRVQPAERWSVTIGGCIESTPAVWEGRIFVGTRGGRFFSLGDDGTQSSPGADRVDTATE